MLPIESILFLTGEVRAQYSIPVRINTEDKINVDITVKVCTGTLYIQFSSVEQVFHLVLSRTGNLTTVYSVAAFKYNICFRFCRFSTHVKG